MGRTVLSGKLPEAWPGRVGEVSFMGSFKPLFLALFLVWWFVSFKMGEIIGRVRGREIKEREASLGKERL